VNTDAAAADPSWASKVAESAQNRLDPLFLHRLSNECCYGDVIVPGTRTGDLEAVIAAKKGVDVSWLGLQPHWAAVISDVNEDGSRRFIGRESAAYIYYIIQRYDSLPRNVVFMHHHRGSWEANDNAKVLAAVDPYSYDFAGLGKLWAVDLRPQDMINTRKFFADVVDDESLSKSVPFEQYAWSYPIGGTFLVSAARIQELSKETWQRIFDWIQKGDRHGDVLEFSWHLLFGEPAEMLPPKPTRLCPKEPNLCSHDSFTEMGGITIPGWRQMWFESHNFW